MQLQCYRTADDLVRRQVFDRVRVEARVAKAPATANCSSSAALDNPIPYVP
jgi:hypothetical protein